jgi:Arc/MetJ-type ribon-helix-helix transcriptional regulator
MLVLVHREAIVMNYPLSADLQQRIDAQLAAGGFASEEDVLREAIEALERRQRGLAQLRAMVAVAEEDVAASRIGTFDRDEIKREVRNRLSDQGIRD